MNHGFSKPEVEKPKPHEEKIPAKDVTLYLADDRAGEFELWIEDFVIIGLAPTRRGAIADGISFCEDVIESLRRKDAELTK